VWTRSTIPKRNLKIAKKFHLNENNYFYKSYRNIYIAIQKVYPKNVAVSRGDSLMMDAASLFEERLDDRRQKILKVISRSGMSNILFSLEKSPLRFSQLMFETKLNPGILDRHLKALIQLNIIEKNTDSYELTDSGKKLVRVLQQLFSIV